MTETTNLNICIDKHLKEQAEVFSSELGLNSASAFYGPTNMAVLRQSIQEANEGRFVTKTMDELRAMEE